MKVYGHPWSINTRKTLAALAEKQHAAEFALVMLPKGEQKPQHVALHPFGKVPVLDDDGFVLYETRAINAYLDRRLGGTPLIPRDSREAARMDQWINSADSYFVPFAHGLIFEMLFRRYLGGGRDEAKIAASREGMGAALDSADRALASTPYFAGSAFSLADIHWLPYLEYLVQLGEAELVTKRRNLSAWWERVSSRAAWQRVARSGPQPYEPGMTAEVVEKQYRG